MVCGRYTTTAKCSVRRVISHFSAAIFTPCITCAGEDRWSVPLWLGVLVVAHGASRGVYALRDACLLSTADAMLKYHPHS